MTHKPKKVGQTFMYKEGIYDYRGAKLWCETKKVKNPYGSWRYNMYFDVNGEEVCQIRQTPESILHGKLTEFAKSTA